MCSFIISVVKIYYSTIYFIVLVEEIHFLYVWVVVDMMMKIYYFNLFLSVVN